MYSTTDPSRKYGIRAIIRTFGESQVHGLYSHAMVTPRLLDQVRTVARVKHFSLSTEKAYVSWIRRFILFHNKRHPAEMAEPEIREFLSHLAVDRRISASTQTVALSALLFLYRDVLKQELAYVSGIERAKRSHKLPVVFTRTQTHSVLAHLAGTHYLIASLLYGAGLRLMEAVRLRVKDIDFDLNQITIREGKGAKDRVTMLPRSIHGTLQEHLLRVKAAHQSDLKEGFGRVYLPFALEKKYANAAKAWGWQCVSRNEALNRSPHRDRTPAPSRAGERAASGEVSNPAGPGPPERQLSYIQTQFRYPLA